MGLIVKAETLHTYARTYQWNIMLVFCTHEIWNSKNEDDAKPLTYLYRVYERASLFMGQLTLLRSTYGFKVDVLRDFDVPVTL